MIQSVFGKSIRGAAHIRSGVECQDSLKKVILNDGTIILAVADGHGSKSCPFSRTGSKIAVNVFCDILKELYEGYNESSDNLPSYFNREGDTMVSKAIDAEWKRRVLERHKRYKRNIAKLPDGKYDFASVYKQYGTTLLGLMITRTFVFAFQLGDGDVCYVSDGGLDMVITPERILGVETYSLSRENSWEKAITTVRRINISDNLPAFFSLSTDGYANSYKCEEEFQETIKEYLPLLKEHGVKIVSDSLAGWLSETSQMGSGDDVTMLAAYFAPIGEPVENGVDDAG